MSKIMLVEDDKTMLSLLQTLLQMEGFEVVQYKEERLDKILEVMRQEKPEVTLVDVNLHFFSGLDLLHQIRQDTALASSRVIMSSGIDYSDKCFAEGADAFILKPYMPDDLIKEIRQALKT